MEQVILDPLTIRKEVANHFRVSEDLLMKDTRKREVIKVKHIAMCLCREYTRLSLAQIGMIFGDRDHASVLHACRSVNNQADIYKCYREGLDELRLKLIGTDLFERYKSYNTDNV
jgi:chromosomal replication initiator protein